MTFLHEIIIRTEKMRKLNSSATNYSHIRENNETNIFSDRKIDINRKIDLNLF